MTIGITCIDSHTYQPTLYALNRTIDTLKDKVEISTIYWFSDIDFPIETNINVKWIKIPKFTDFQEQYSYITLKLCPEICTDDFNLIIHADGYAVNSDAWTDEFFEYDYIGAMWEDGEMGNGGFCLRSKKLYDTVKALDIPYKLSSLTIDQINKKGFYTIQDGLIRVPEDVILCRIYKTELEKNGIKFAPYQIADRFSIECHTDPCPWTGYSNLWLGKSLGFHGKWGIRSFYNV